MVYSNSPEIGAFEVRNYEFLKNLIADNSIPCEWQTVSVVHGYMAKDMFDLKVSKFKKLQKEHPEIASSAQYIMKDSQSPSLVDLRVPNAEGAFVESHAASLWPYKLVASILERQLQLNQSTEALSSFNLQTNTPVTHIQHIEDGTWLVHTPRGMVAAKNVILTTNGYTSHLLPKFTGIIVPVRGEMSSLIPPPSMKPNTDNPPLGHSYGFVGHARQNINQDDYLIQRPWISGGELMFGGGRSYAAKAGLGISDDSSIDPPAAAFLRRELKNVVDINQEEKELKATFEWSGIMGYSRDGHPWVGQVTENLGLGGGEGLWICAGFTGHGMPNTSLCAKATADMLLGTDPAKVDLPTAYHLTKERVEAAKAMDEVHIADAKRLDD
jgi:glycine/D-amino acid oxidase-like deaminating enzyme